MITTVLIDVDDTLLDFNKSARLSAEVAFSKCNLPFSDLTYETFLSVNDELWKKVEKGDITRDDLHDVRWNIILGKLGQLGDGHKIEKCFLDALFDCAVLKDGAIDICEYLSNKYTLCTASNAPHLQQINRLTISGLKPFISQIFTSEEAGVSKPDTRFFDVCMNRLNGIKKEQIIMIGDSLSADIEGAKKYGLKTIWLNNKGKENNCEFADYIVNSLEQIKDIL